MLLTHDHKDVRIAVHEAGVSCVLDKSGAEEHDVKLASEWAPQQVQKILCLTRVGGSHDQGVEGQLSRVHASLYLCVCVSVCLHTLVPSTAPIPAAFS